MSKILIISIFSLFFYSCILPHVKEDYYLRYNNNSNIASLINIDGIYFPENVINGLDSLTLSNEGWFLPMYVFYKNGMTTKNIPGEWYVSNINNNNSNISNGGVWGTYSLNNDTIITQYIASFGGQTRHIHTVKFEVIDKNTIKQTCCFRHKDGTSEVKVFKFIPHDYLPNSEKSWLIKQKWFWCNKNDWKQFMDSVKQNN